MRGIIVTALLIAAMVICGWLTFNRDDGSASATFHADEAKQDTAAAVEKGKELVDEGKQMLKKAGTNPDADSSESTGN